MSASPRLPLRTFVVATVLALIAAVATYLVLSDDDSGGTATPRAGTVELDREDAPDPSEVSFTTFDGEVIALASLRGEPVLVNFFASTCTPCIKEMPALEAAHQAVGDQVRFLGLAALGDRPEAALELVDRTGITYDVGRDVDGSVFTSVGGLVLPTTVIFSADGELIEAHTGELTEPEILEMIDRSLGVTP